MCSACACVHRHTRSAAVVAEVLGALLCLAITGSGTLFGRYPQRRAARNEPVQQTDEKRKKKVQHGGELVLLLIAVCPIPPARGKSLFLPLLVTKSFPALHSTLQV